MGNVDFMSDVRQVASNAGITLDGVKSGGASAVFRFSHDGGGSSRQTVYVIPFGDTWEFSCLSVINAADPEDLPKGVLLAALKDSATNRRGFWCVQKESSGQNYLESMHNLSRATLTPRDFNETCWSVARHVDVLENGGSG
jgi:hypothetical protein